MNGEKRAPSGALRTIVAIALVTIVAVGLPAIEVDGESTLSTASGASGTVVGGSGELSLIRRFGQDARLVATGGGAVDSEADGHVYLRRAEYEQTFSGAEGRRITRLAIGRGAIAARTPLLAPLAGDGLEASVRVPGFGIDASARTLALVQPDRSLLLSASDVAGRSKRFGPNRFLTTFTLLAPERVWRTNLALEYLGQLDGRALTDPEPGEDIAHAHYVSALIDAPLGTRLFASASLTGSRGLYRVVAEGATRTLSMIARAQARGYAPGRVRPRGTIGVLYASGRGQEAVLPDPNDTAPPGSLPGPFVPPWTLAPLPLQNVVSVTADASIAPIAGTTLRGRAALLAKPAPGAFGIPNLRSGDATGLYGSELELEALFEPFRDLESMVRGAIFLPDTSEKSGVFTRRTAAKWTIEGSVTLAW